MKPGEIMTAEGTITLNEGRENVEIEVANAGDRPVQVGSHYHFYEANEGLLFDREAARGFRLDIPAGTAVRFEPGQTRSVRLVAYDGLRVGEICGLNHSPFFGRNKLGQLLLKASLRLSIFPPHRSNFIHEQ